MFYYSKLYYNIDVRPQKYLNDINFSCKLNYLYFYYNFKSKDCLWAISSMDLVS